MDYMLQLIQAGSVFKTVVFILCLETLQLIDVLINAHSHILQMTVLISVSWIALIQ